MQDMEAVCALVATRRLTETEAASLQGIGQEQWFNFKDRNKNRPKFDEIVTRIRAANINSCLNSIDEAGDPQQFVNRAGETVERSGDWRAKAWLAERVLSPARFGQQAAKAAEPPLTLNINLGEAIKRAYATVECPPAAKQIEGGTKAGDVVESK